MRTLNLGILFFIMALAACTSSEQRKEVDYSCLVNPFIGTDFTGNTYPGAQFPFGMVQLSPDNGLPGWDRIAGYYYPDSTIAGFSHTHLSGTGAGDLYDISFMPVTVPYKEADAPLGIYSKFSHKNEKAFAGYYQVWLEDYNINVELTATPRCGIQRYTFPAAESAIFLNLSKAMNWDETLDSYVEVVDSMTLRGYRYSNGWARNQKIYFYAKFSKPFSYTIVSDTLTDRNGQSFPRCKALLQFATAKDEQVMVKFGISAVDIEGAKNNVNAEIPDWNFEKVKSEAYSAWNNYLSKVEITTTDKDEKTKFYTALYHTAISPNLCTDTDGRYLGMDLKVHQGRVEEPVYTNFSLWNTFRALHPLLSIIAPKLNNQFINSLLLKNREGGILPMWDLASNYTGTMIGYHAVSLLADAYVKGYADFDLDEAYGACLRAAEYDTTGIQCPSSVLPCLMPMSKYYKNKIGYIPCDRENESVAKALEYAYDDFCISILAEADSDFRNYEKYNRYAKAYKLYFDPVTRFMRGLDSEGEWHTPFNPRSSNHRNDDYCEGTAWQWTWFVPHDIEGLIDVMGGQQAFVEKLDSLFTVDSTMEGNLVSADVTGLIGQYAHENEPSHHVIHLYNYAGRPWRTQELADYVCRNLYRNAPDGLTGNEDCGQMSAWYVLNAMGFYQVCPGKPVYSIGRPLFDKTVIKLADGKRFVIKTKNNSVKNKYIKSATLNQHPLHTPFLTHEDIMKGGILEFVMTDVPSTWGQ